MVHNKALSHNLKLTPIKLDRHAGSMVQSPVEKRLNDFALPQPLLDPNQRGTEPLFFLDKAMGACKAANHEHGKYPSIYEEIVQKQKQRWMEGQKDHRYNFIQMINSKLGGYVCNQTRCAYATCHFLWDGQGNSYEHEIIWQ
jgi:hypothetical protein